MTFAATEKKNVAAYKKKQKKNLQVILPSWWIIPRYPYIITPHFVEGQYAKLTTMRVKYVSANVMLKEVNVDAMWRTYTQEYLECCC